MSPSASLAAMNESTRITYACFMATEPATWHIPLKRRGASGRERVNFLWQRGNVFVMDNHRLAAWCWLKQLAGAEDFSLLHLDRHYDMLDVQDAVIDALPGDLGAYSLEQYLGATCRIEGYEHRAVRWDNYIPILLKKKPGFLRKMFAITQGSGNFQPWMADALRQGFLDENELWDIPDNLADWIGKGGAGGYSNAKIDREYKAWTKKLTRALTGKGALPDLRKKPKRDDSPDRWIFNLDLDLFFFGESKPRRFLTDDYVAAVVEALRDNMKACEVFTICLSPECCGGWSEAEQVMAIVNDVLRLGFELPRQSASSASPRPRVTARRSRPRAR